MAQNRTIPYGYHVKDGTLTAHPEESQVVKEIFHLYAVGNSYLTIARQLTVQGIRYIPEKPDWNKNMVARILQNEKYLGTDIYPALIEPSQFQKSIEAKKPYTHTESKEIQLIKGKLVCKQCGQALKRRLRKNGEERWYCPISTTHIALTLTDKIIVEHILELQGIFAQGGLQDRESHPLSLETARIEQEIDQLLQDTEIQMEAIKASVLKLAEMKYELCPNTYNQNQLEFIQKNPNVVDQSLIGTLVTQICVSENQVDSLLLKNGRVINRKDDVENGKQGT